MEFSLILNLEAEEKEILTAAAEIIDNLIIEMEYTGLETYQGKYSCDWQKIRSAIQDLIM